LRRTISGSGTPSHPVSVVMAGLPRTCAVFCV
jgi:hypothetical protein